MIAVDTSALMAVVLGEPEADACIRVLEAENDLLISAGTVAEAFIVSARRNVGEEMARLINGLGFKIVNVTLASARRIAGAYETWGKGLHPAALNFGDCFAYAVAKEYGCRLLYVGNDFFTYRHSGCALGGGGRWWSRDPSAAPILDHALDPDPTRKQALRVDQMTIDIEKLRADMAVENKRFAVRAIGVATGCIAAGATLALLVFHLMGKI